MKDYRDGICPSCKKNYQLWRKEKNNEYPLHHETTNSFEQEGNKLLLKCHHCQHEFEVINNG